MYSSWDMAHDRCNYYSSSWAIFALLRPWSPKYQNLEKVKKAPGDILILHMRTKNYVQMMYGSWDMVREGYNYFSFWVIFYPFTP